MTAAAIRQKLYEYIRVADEKKVRAFFTLVEDEINDFDWKNDDQFLTELAKRSDEYKTGKVKGIPWEDVKKKNWQQKKIKYKR